MALESEVGKLLFNLVDILKSNVVSDVQEFTSQGNVGMNSEDLRAMSVRISQSIDANSQPVINQILKTVRFK